MDEFESNSKNENANSAENDDSKKNISIPSAENKAIAKADTNKKQKDWPNWIQATTAIILILITGTYTYYAREQVKETRRAVDIASNSYTEGKKSMDNTLSEMKRQSKAMQDAADANKNAVKVAEGSIKATQEQFRLEQRAWINIGIGNFEEPLDDKKIPVYKFKATNSGKTPAYIKTMHYKLWHRDSAGKDIIITETINNDETCFGPGETQAPIISLRVPIHQSLIAAIKAEKETLFLEIEIIYFDIYKPKIKRHTRACFYYNTAVKEFLYGKHCSYMD